MAKKMQKDPKAKVSSPSPPLAEYGQLLLEISKLLTHSRRTAARAVNAVLTATYWEIGRRIVESEMPCSATPLALALL